MHGQDFLTTAAMNRLYRQALSDQRFSEMSEEGFYRTLVLDVKDQADVRLKQIRGGPDTGKLTLEERTKDGTWVGMGGITPVDCYNLLPHGKTIADMERLFGPYAMLILPDVQPAAQTPIY